MATNTPNDQWELQLTESNILFNFLEAFSLENPPVRIVYNKGEYNLTEAYETFWKQFYNTSGLVKGKYYVLPQASTSIWPNEMFSAIPMIIKRGWQDERYLPTRLCTVFLKASIFGEKDHLQLITNISAEMCLDLLPEADERTSMNDLEIWPTVEKWNKVLESLMNKDEFNFLVNQNNAWESRNVTCTAYDDISLEEDLLPHNMWRTFFYSLGNDVVEFYWDILGRKKFICYCCGQNDVRSKHILGSIGDNCWSAMKTERHDSVLKMIVKQIALVMDPARSSFFSGASDWQPLLRLMSVGFNDVFPDELDPEGKLRAFPTEQTPHFLIYSMAMKKAIIIEVTVMWEEWIRLPIERRQYPTKRQKLSPFVSELENYAFEVQFRDIEMGCRGVFCKGLFKLLKEDLCMNHEEVSRFMEEVSKSILSIAYEHYKQRKP